MSCDFDCPLVQNIEVAHHEVWGLGVSITKHRWFVDN